MTTVRDIPEEFLDVVGSGCPYEVKRAIGKGTFASVFQLEQRSTGRAVVGKFMDTTKMTEKNRNFALGEANNASKCSHPNIIEFIERFERHGKLLLVFEFADAGDLHGQVNARAPNRYFREAEILLIFSQLCLALNHIHRRKIMHRDLKTPNVFLTTCGLVKLGDFGFSRQYEETLSQDVGNTFCGTPYYLSPELWNQATYSSKADIWSLGVVLYELMALKRPFGGGTMRELIDNVLGGRAEELPQHYSKELRELCMDMLNTDPNKRPSIQQVMWREVVRVNGLSSLQKNVPRLVNVPEKTRIAIVEDIKEVIAAMTPLETSPTAPSQPVVAAAAAA